MKTRYYTTVLLVLLIASEVIAGQAVDLQDFSQYRQMMLPVLTKSIEPLKQTRKCVAESANSEQLNVCIKIMADSQRTASSGNHIGGQVGPQMPRMVWSKALAEQIHNDLDRSLTEAEISIKCLQSSDSRQAMAECKKSARGR